jgi:hypothetical protein
MSVARLQHVSDIYKYVAYQYEDAGPSGRAFLGVGLRPLPFEIVGSNPTGGMDVCPL